MMAQGGDDSAAFVRRRVTVTAVRRTVMRADGGGEPSARVPCPVCRRDVEAVTPAEACRLLRTDTRRLQELVCLGFVHAIATASGAVWICKESVFREIGP
jgi:hypothetical protein